MSVFLDNNLGVLVGRGVLIEDLLGILDRLELVPLSRVLTRLEQLDEGVVGHVLVGVAEAFSLSPDVVVLVLLKLLV